jgi:S-methylmethionine-dependent homocysteine/selenocysteine methylase
MSYRDGLPQLESLFLTDGGLETTLIFHQGLDLPEFAAFDLLKSDDGAKQLRSYFEPYLAVAREKGVGFVLDTATWRANPDWAEKLGYSMEELDEANRTAVELAEEIRAGEDIPVVIDGVVGPRGDGYDPDEFMSANEAEEYHSVQIGTFSRTAADMVSAITMTYPEEAIGIVRAAASVRMPVVVSFTVETDGRLPNGQPLKEAIEHVDAETDGRGAYFMINCAHPQHFADVLEDDGAWLDRIGGLRANASTKSHEELDEAEELDAGDPVQLGADYKALRPRLRSVAVLGGCCGTDHRHVGEVCNAWLN